MSATLPVESSHSALDLTLGLAISLISSLANALGLTLVKLDHLRGETLAVNRSIFRPLFLAGQALYLLSQIVGSTFALSFLSAAWVAPLGAAALIFNVIFAKLLLGTAISKLDIAGTFVIILGVIGVVLFGSHRNSNIDVEANLNFTIIQQLWGRSQWIAFFLLTGIASIAFFWLSEIIDEVRIKTVVVEREDENDRGIDGMTGGRRQTLSSNPTILERLIHTRLVIMRLHTVIRNFLRRRIESWSASRPDSSIRKLTGLMYALTGGILAGQTLVLAKSAVKLIASAIHNDNVGGPNQFSSPLSWFIIIMLLLEGFAQVYCLNAALRAYESTFTVPIFFATYTISAFLNSLVYLDTRKDYSTKTFVLIWLSVALLIAGVCMLASKKVALTKQRLRGDSIAQEEGGGVELETLSTENSTSNWFSRKFGGRGVTQSKNRNRKGNERLEETDGGESLFAPIGSEQHADELDPIDPFGDEDDDLKDVVVFDAEADEGRKKSSDSFDHADYDGKRPLSQHGEEEDEFGEFEGVEDFSTVHLNRS